MFGCFSINLDFSMVFLFPNYFDCDPFELNFRLFVFGGFWPLETNVRWKKILFSIFSFLSYFSMTSIIFVQVVDLYLLRNDPVGFTKDLSTNSISYVICIKSILVLYNVKVVTKLKDELTQYKNSRKDPSEIKILENSNAQILLVVKTLYTLALPCVLFWLLYPGLDSPNKGVPFPYRLPVEEWSFTVYVSLYIYQSLSVVGYMINTLAVDAMFCGFVLRINAHYDIVIKSVLELGRLDGKLQGLGQEEEARTARTILRKSIKLHQKILRELKTFEEIYSSPCFIHFVGLTVNLGTTIIHFLKIIKEIKFQILQKLLFVSAAMWDSFLYCFYATKMQQKSLELSRAAYEVHWYNMKPKLRKDLLFVLFKAQNEPKVKVAHFFDLNLGVLLQILKISYDITALLFKTVKE